MGSAARGKFADTMVRNTAKVRKAVIENPTLSPESTGNIKTIPLRSPRIRIGITILITK